MRRIQWNLISSLNKTLNINKQMTINSIKFLHSAIKEQSAAENNLPKNHDFKINKANILEKLNLINQKLKNQEYDSHITNKAIELNFPIYPKYVNFLLNSLLKSNVHYIIDYKYCNEVIINTFFFYMITCVNKNITNEKQNRIRNIIIYETEDHLKELERHIQKFNFNEKNTILSIHNKEALVNFHNKYFKEPENQIYTNAFPQIVFIKCSVFTDLIKTEEYSDCLNKNAFILFYKFSQGDEVDRVINMIDSLLNRYILFDSNLNSKLKAKTVKNSKVLDYPTEEQHLELKIFEDNYNLMVYDSNSEEKIINEVLEKSLYKILEKHSNLLMNSNDKLNLGLFCTKQFLTQDIIKNLQKYRNKIMIDFVFNSATPAKENKYDLIIDLNFIDYENMLRTTKHLREHNFSGEINSYYSFIPDFKLDEIQRIILKENIPIKIRNFVNEEYKEENYINNNNNLVKIANKDEFEIYDEIIDKLVDEAKHSIYNKGITNLFYQFKRDDKLMEDMIYDYIYSNQKEFLEEKKFNYSLITGKEGLISLRIYLDENQGDKDIKEFQELLVKAQILSLESIHENLKPVFSSKDYCLDVDVNKYQEVVKIFEEIKIKIKVFDQLPIIVNSPFL